MKSKHIEQVPVFLFAGGLSKHIFLLSNNRFLQKISWYCDYLMGKVHYSSSSTSGTHCIYILQHKARVFKVSPKFADVPNEFKLHMKF